MPFAQRRQQGFTLVELLLALAMTALIGASAYAALEGVGRSRIAFEEKSEKLAELQRFLTIFGNDVRQVSGMQNRSAEGDLEEPLVVDEGEETLLILNRRGWHNPLASPRSEMQRVYYRYDGEQLYRGYWVAFDRIDDTLIRERPILKDLAQISLRVLPAEQTGDIDRQWTPRWPQGEEGAPVLPAALELTIELGSMGELRRVYELLPQT
jgi:general secretion pathway protein J